MAVSTPVDPIKNIGNDSTATFENDPKFTEPTPGSEGSSDNLEEQARDTDDLEDSEEEVEDEEDDVDEDEEFDDTDEEDEDDEDLDDEDDEDEEDDEEEVGALHADSLLGSEDETRKGRADIDLDDDAGDVDPGITTDTFTDDDMDTDRVAALAVDFLNWPAGSYNFGSYIGTQPSTFGTLQ